ncbi:tRNA dihydrouridine synthase DusB [candidate division KSB1 bacterium]|nr:tRNA dihydrouridine synthase DusB [candidate division KSB1 bacterium]RQW07307.1 MAG: tRNA dihydrouridine synthase DusB [candidate division KSB1 bacterium]
MKRYPLVLAPLAGWSDAPFRRLCREYGADMVYTEMVSADGAIREQKKTLALAEFDASERPIVIQVFGAEPETIAGAVEIIARKRPDAIDINFGCPSRKITKRGGGSALLRDINLLQKIALAAVRATDIPISAKLRSGWDTDSINLVETSMRLQDAGVQMLAVHPRTQTQQFKGLSDWSLIKRVKATVNIPVIGNGDVRTAHDARRMFLETGCDAVMIGRSACGNPWIFRHVSTFLATGEEPSPPSFAERVEVCLRHLALNVAAYGDRRGVQMMKKQIALYLRGFPCAGAIRQKIFAMDRHADVADVLSEYLHARQ